VPGVRTYRRSRVRIGAPGTDRAILSPQLTCTHGHHDPNASLPYASSLCGACFDACPVRIDIPSILVHLRAKQVDSERGGVLSGQDLAMKAAAWAMRSPKRFSIAEKELAAGQIIANSDHRITALPWPGSRWTAVIFPNHPAKLSGSGGPEHTAEELNDRS
jgi:L-lactate dehydrogenase complex protein LldF